MLYWSGDLHTCYDLMEDGSVSMAGAVRADKYADAVVVY